MLKKIVLLSTLAAVFTANADEIRPTTSATELSENKAGVNVTKSTFITLGTKGGPLLSAKRSQPANALIDGDNAYLIDVGDGAASNFASLGMPLKAIKGIFISHLHFDHTAGLLGVLGLRYQTSAQKTLTIYGPPGTKQTVDGIFAAMVPEMRVGYAVEGARKPPTPQEKTIVIEMTPGQTIDVNGMLVTAVENTHYSIPKGSIAASLNKSFAYRFDLADRSMVFTGDTGPSKNIEQLAQGADILISEMMDIPFIINAMKKSYAKVKNPPPAKLLEGVFQHLRDHHVTALQVGEMAAAAGVKEVIVTHIAVNESPEALKQYEADIAKNFDGNITLAEDMQKF